MADITHNDPLVTESKLTEFYNDIKPFLGCPAYVTQEGDAEYYSTDEKVIGRWTDNKPLYQRTLFISSSYTSEVVIPNTGIGVSVSGVTDVFVSDIKPTLDKIINIQMDTNNRSYSGSSFHHSYPFRFNKDNGYVATVDNYNVGYQENIALYPGTSFTFKYTKSTDSAVTTTEQKPTHYSTDEQVVGTWIDGKPVYQKTITIASSDWTKSNKKYRVMLADKISNVKEVIDFNGFIKVIYSSQSLTYGFGTVDTSTTGELSIISNYSQDAICVTDLLGVTMDSGSIITFRYTKTTD